MLAGIRSDVPEGSLLHRYAVNPCGEVTANYTDSFEFSVDCKVTLADFVEAFYTSRLFWFERTLLRVFLRKPATDEDARALAQNDANHFSAWTVEARTQDEILLSDFSGATRSWLMVYTEQSGNQISRTRLCFGSAVVARTDPGSDEAKLGVMVYLLLGFHKLYSRALIASSRSKLVRMINQRSK